jgi:hypothetical protein
MIIARLGKRIGDGTSEAVSRFTKLRASRRPLGFSPWLPLRAEFAIATDEFSKSAESMAV